MVELDFWVTVILLGVDMIWLNQDIVVIELDKADRNRCSVYAVLVEMLFSDSQLDCGRLLDDTNPTPSWSG